MNKRNTLRRLTLELLFLAGLALACWGVWQICPSAGYISGGITLAIVSVIGMLGSTPAPEVNDKRTETSARKIGKDENHGDHR